MELSFIFGFSLIAFNASYWAGLKGDFDYQVVTTTGVEVETGSGSNQLTFGQNYSSGIYIIEITTNEGNQSLKFFKK